MTEKQTYQVPMTTSKVQEMTKMALCVALLAVAAYISFPLPFTPAMVTGLTVAVNLVAFILPPKKALLVMIIYVLLGAVGVPVFVGGTAGLGKIFGPTGGFIIGFVVAAFAIGVLIAIIELPCTGQAYLPTIAYMVRDAHLRTHALLHLLLYNVLFIAPLVAIFILAAFGMTHERLAAALRQRAALVKFATAALFFVLFAVFLRSF